MGTEEDGAKALLKQKESETRRPAFMELPPEWTTLSERVIACAMQVHSTLGPGFVERAYEEALCFELASAGIPFARQPEVAIRYKEISLPPQRLDLVVANLLVVELKAVEAVHDTHLAQLVSYLRAANLPLGLLINFNTARLKDGLYRRLNDRAFPPGMPRMKHPANPA